ncbi:hypothetical protein BDV98DRAFT_567929 [Pterulicium gracile]|uniref:Uncharacterized protein n=1 Tax=Pterulicium gracile TaxID=1884261 RepID=A0A5C3QJ36_9AGAR|nr:hypothetical protein BDV98DRAFT_567929 [Pterula gracilis]
MRRAQSVRNRARPSGFVDELGIVGEDESPEETARRQLLDAQRENDRLKNQVSVLQAQLHARPPPEKMQELQKENANLELILQGMQRENERSAADLARKDVVQKMLEAELARLLGDNWKDKLDFPSSVSAAGLNASPSSTSGPPTAPSSNRTQGKPAPLSKEDRHSTLNRLEQIRLLILGMEARMVNREDTLNKVVGRAEDEGRKWEALAG